MCVYVLVCECASVRVCVGCPCEPQQLFGSVWLSKSSTSSSFRLGHKNQISINFKCSPFRPFGGETRELSIKRSPHSLCTIKTLTLAMQCKRYLCILASTKVCSYVCICIWNCASRLTPSLTPCAAWMMMMMMCLQKPAGVYQLIPLTASNDLECRINPTPGQGRQSKMAVSSLDFINCRNEEKRNETAR